MKEVFCGIHLDEKPTGVPDGSEYIEVDTKDIYIFYNGTWYKQKDKVLSKLETKQITITENETKTYSPSEGKIGFSTIEITTNVSGASVDWSEYFYKNVFGGNSGTNNFTNWAVKKFPDNFLEISSNTISLKHAFADMKSLVTAPELNTLNIQNFQYMFNKCDNLENVPVYDASGASTSTASMEYMFSSAKLTDQSLDNILQMCISAPAGMSGRNLARLGLTASAYPVEKIQSLSHYSDFINAGWTIGY